MAQRKKTGDIISEEGDINAGDIVTGLKATGDLSDSVLQDALEVMEHLNTGKVQAKGDIEAERIITGVVVESKITNVEELLAVMKALRETLAELRKEPEASAEVEAAGRSLDEAITEAEKEKPLGRMVLNRLRDTVEFMADAGKLLETADKAGPLIAQAITTAVMLYQLAGTLF